MTAFAAFTSARAGIPRAVAVATLGVLLALGVIPASARYLIPLGGMVIGNSMNAASLTLTRVRDDLAEQRQKVEAALALGATSRPASSSCRARWSA